MVALRSRKNEPDEHDHAAATDDLSPIEPQPAGIPGQPVDLVEG